MSDPVKVLEDVIRTPTSRQQSQLTSERVSDASEHLQAGDAVSVAECDELAEQLRAHRGRHPHEVAHDAFSVLRVVVLQHGPKATECAVVEGSQGLDVEGVIERVRHRSSPSPSRAPPHHARLRPSTARVRRALSKPLPT